MLQTSTRKYEYVVINEIQKIPQLLNEVHRLIEKHGIQFLLTGSSVRKLKRSGVNLLAGRAWLADMLPLSMQEIPDFNLDRYLLYGGLPPIYLSKSPAKELSAYVDVYLQEEIQAESHVRNILSFSRFLQIAAATNGQVINFSSRASDISVPASTVREYYQLLEDTLMGFQVPAWQKSVKRKAIKTAKFYFFDIGVRNRLCGISAIDIDTDSYGSSFEHFIAMELRAFLSYERINLLLSYWRVKGGKKVDFIIGDDIAIEVKSAESMHGKHLEGLMALKEEGICKQYYLVCHCLEEREVEGIHIIHWKRFFELLWERSIL